MAMFVSFEVPFKVRRAPWLFHSADEATQKGSKSRRRLQLLSEMYSPSESDDDAHVWTFQSKDAIPKPDIFALQPRKAVSLNEVGNSEREPKWPGNVVSPVSPTVPRYPPPVRTPTPPGLPSFGTQDAMAYSAQFLGRARANPPNEQNSQGRRADGRNSEGHRTGSYGEALRRLLGLSPPASSQHDRPPTGVIGRAADGTAVQGRFPYRQSGHGSNVARRLEDHPFHRRTIPAALHESVDPDGSPATQHGPSTDAKGDPPVANPTHPRADRRTNRLHVSNRPMPPSHLPSIPARAVTAQPRATSTTALFSLPRHFSHNIRAPQPHSRLGTPARGDGASAGPGITDGASDSCLTQSQPRLAETMQASRGAGEELLDDQKPSGFWAMTRSCFCRPLWDENVRFSPRRSRATGSSSAESNARRGSGASSGVDWQSQRPERSWRHGSVSPYRSNIIVDPMAC